MFLLIFVFFIQFIKLHATIPYDGIIHRTSDGSSYAFLSPPKTGNHAASIEQMTPTGNLAVAWFSGGENTPNCSIALSVLEVGSQQFTPGIIDNQTQILHLYHSSQLGNAGETNAQLWHLQSKDRGATWSTPEPFYILPGAFDRNRIIPTLNNDGIIIPCYNSSPDVDSSFLLRLSSRKSELIRTDIKETLFRDENAISIYYADSNDDGLTWTTPKLTSLPNNNAAIEVYTLKNGAVIMAFNNLNRTHPRSPLTVALSYDNGMTWPYKRDVQIYDDDDKTHIGEYSYPSLVQSFWSGSDDNDIHLVYTYNEDTIKYLRFNERWIKQG